MGTNKRRDFARQAANVAGAFFQVAVPILTSPAIGQVSEENRTLVVPAGYAFAIWNLIFLLCFVYAAYRALPANRDNPLLRRVGWFFAGAFFLDGLWEILFPAQQFLIAEVVIVSTFVCLAAAYLQLVREARGRALSGAESWLVALLLGLFFGWITAATFVSIATTSVALGLLGGGTGEALVGAVLLLLGGLLASAVILYGRLAPGPRFYLPYAAAILWALIAVIVNQYDDSVLTTGAAVVAVVLVASALFGALREGSTGQGRIAKPGAA
jgi:hypothetical protein